MGQFYLPRGMRFATLEERKQFYTGEFALRKVSEWFRPNLGNTCFAVIMGKHTKIVQDNIAKTQKSQSLLMRTRILRM